MLEPLLGVPVPDLTDPMYAPYWDGTGRQELTLPSCGDCGRVAWPPRAACPHCACEHFDWKVHNPVGSLFSWTVIHHATAEGFSSTPYVVAIVELDHAPGVRLLGNVLVDDPNELTVGSRVQGVFRRAGVGEAMTVLWWTEDLD